MKNIGKLLFITLLISSTTNCKKKDTTPDLTTNIVGIYGGSIEYVVSATRLDTTYQSQQVQITKLSNTEIQIEPYNNSVGSSFTANLSQSGNTIILSIPQENLTGGSIQSEPGDTSKFNTTTKQFNYDIQITYNGVVSDERFTGVKQ